MWELLSMTLRARQKPLLSKTLFARKKMQSIMKSTTQRSSRMNSTRSSRMTSTTQRSSHTLLIPHSPTQCEYGFTAADLCAACYKAFAFCSFEWMRRVHLSGCPYIYFVWVWDWVYRGLGWVGFNISTLQGTQNWLFPVSQHSKVLKMIDLQYLNNSRVLKMIDFQYLNNSKVFRITDFQYLNNSRVLRIIDWE